MKEKIKQLQQQVDALKPRERLLIMLTALVTVVMVLQLLLLDPLLADRTLAQQQLKASQADSVKSAAAIALLQAELTVGVNRNEIRQRERLTKELGQLDEKIQQSVVAMIPPELMPQVLETLLNKSKGLRLLALENKPVSQLLTQQQQNREDEAGGELQALYRHGFILQLSGNYASIIDYFKQLSALPWHFHWDELHYTVDEYPNATVRLEVHTVSMDEEWIGV